MIKETKQTSPTQADEIRALVDRLAARCESKAFSNQPEVRRDLKLAVHLLQHLLAMGTMFEDSAHTAIADFRGNGKKTDPHVATAVAGLLGILSQIDEVRARRPDRRRRAAMYAVHAVVAFLVRINKKRAPTAALNDVSSALFDLERGAKPSLFEAELPGSRPPDSIDRVQMKGIAAAAMSAMMKAGLSREDAAQRVANELRRAGVDLGGRRHLDGGTVASWRDQARAAKDGNEISMVYRLCMDGGRLQGPMSPPITWDFDEQQCEHYCRGVLLQLSKSLTELFPDSK
jgi:hypothetical protein